jgi:hypothetical protein
MIWLWWVGTGFAAFIVSAQLWRWVPKLQMRSVTTGDPKARADVEDNFARPSARRSEAPPTSIFGRYVILIWANAELAWRLLFPRPGGFRSFDCGGSPAILRSDGFNMRDIPGVADPQGQTNTPFGVIA